MPDGLAWNYIQPISLGDAAISTANIYNASKQGVNDSLSRLRQFGEAAIANEANRQAEGKLERFMAALQKHNQAYINNPTDRQSPEQQVVTPTQAPVEAVSQSPAISVQQGNGLARPTNNISVKAAEPYMDIFKATSEKYGVPLPILLGIAQQESGFRANPGNNPNSSAKGIMQFVDSTWKKYGQGKDRLDPTASIDAAGRLLADNYKATNNWQHAIGMYHTGPAAISGNLNNNWGVFANNPRVQKESRHYWATVPRLANAWAQQLSMENIF